MVLCGRDAHPHGPSQHFGRISGAVCCTTLAGRPPRLRRSHGRGCPESLARLGLARTPPGELSGGERQWVLLARALAGNAPLMLMDEPLSNLDPPHQVDWLEQVQCLLAQGTTVVSVLHEISMALHADDIVVMREGQVLHHGAAGDAATHAAIESVFAQRIGIHALNGQWVVLPRPACEQCPCKPCHPNIQAAPMNTSAGVVHYF